MWVNKKLVYRINTEEFIWCITVHNSTGGYRPEHLSQNVANTSENTDLAADQQAQRHSRVQVCPTNVTQALSQRSDGQSKGQWHLHLLGHLRRFGFPDDGR